MARIRKANKSNSLEITVAPFLAEHGYVEKAEADFVWEDGVAKLKLRPKQEGAKENVPTEGAQVIVDGTANAGTDAKKQAND